MQDRRSNLLSLSLILEDEESSVTASSFLVAEKAEEQKELIGEDPCWRYR